MKKLLIAFISTITLTSYIAGMQNNTLTEAGLCIVAQKVYSYIPEKEPVLAQEFTSHISLLNKTLYKDMGDAIAACRIITYFAKVRNENNGNDNNDNGFSVHIAEKFTFPGAKICLALSDQLYNKDLTPDEVKELFNKGAILDYLSSKKRQYPLLYWSSITRKNKETSKAVLKELLDLGADTEQCGLLDYVVGTNLDLTELVLKYNPKMNTQVWASALLAKNRQEILSLLIEHATQDDRNIGLISCFKLWFNNKKIEYEPQVMQQLINNGANPSVALPALMSTLPNITCPTNFEHPFVKNLLLLCANGASDTQTFNQIKFIRDIFEYMVNTMEKNQPSDLSQVEPELK